MRLPSLRRRPYVGPDAHLINGVPSHRRRLKAWWRSHRRGIAITLLDIAGGVLLIYFAALVWLPLAYLASALSCLAIAWVIDRPRP